MISYPHSLWDPDDVENLRSRISLCTKDSARRWGTMSIAGMLAHCTLALEIYSREFELPMHMKWYAPLSKWLALSRVPFPHGIRLPFDLPSEDGLDLEHERSRLMIALDEFSNLPLDHKFRPHFLLGKLTREQFGMLAHKHTDHHLRQFGA